MSFSKSEAEYLLLSWPTFSPNSLSYILPSKTIKLPFKRRGNFAASLSLLLPHWDQLKLTPNMITSSPTIKGNGHNFLKKTTTEDGHNFKIPASTFK